MSWFKGSSLAGAALAVASIAVASAAAAHVKHDGAWPAEDTKVTLDVSATPRTEALRKLADAAGWSLVVHAPPGDPVDVHVKQQPASKVLDILLDDGDYVASRDGTLVSIVRGAADAAAQVPPAPPVAPVPPVPPEAASAPGIHIQIDDKPDDERPHAHGKDRTVMGGNVTIPKGEIAGDVTVFGGNLDIEGESTGDVSVFGGNVVVHDGARIQGDASVFGGKLTLDHGAKIDGDVSCLGGTLSRDPASHIGGDVTVKGDEDDDDGSSKGASPAHPGERHTFIARAGNSVMNGVRLAAVLFVIGTVLLALTGRRMDMLRGEVAARPMRSVALGIVGIFGFVVVIVALCVTVIGAPVAVVAAVLAGFAVLGAMCAVLSVVGEGLLRHKTENPYVHLGVGCALFVALAAIPWVGHFVVIGTILAGIGVLVATRCAGLLVRRNGNGGAASYRSADQSL